VDSRGRVVVCGLAASKGAVLKTCKHCCSWYEGNDYVGKGLCGPCFERWCCLLEAYGDAFKALTLWVCVVAAQRKAGTDRK
jgi:hypothetical protein